MFDFVREDTPGIPVTEEYISQVEQQYGIRFPRLIQEFFLMHNGKKITFLVFRTDELTLSVSRIMTLKDPRFSLEELLDIQREQYFPALQMIPIADDGGNGRYYYHSGNDIVYFSELEAEDDFLPICRGIECFFQILDAAFRSGESNPYEIPEEIRNDATAGKDSFLPLGSIVMLRGGTHKVLIVARGMNVERENEDFFFDYGGVAYPEGFNGEPMVWFNSDGINEVVFYGYMNDEDDVMQTTLIDYLRTHPNINYGTPEQWGDEEA